MLDDESLKEKAWKKFASQDPPIQELDKILERHKKKELKDSKKLMEKIAQLRHAKWQKLLEQEDIEKIMGVKEEVKEVI